MKKLKKNTTIQILSLLFLMAIVLFLLINHDQITKPKPIQKTGFYFNTVISVQLNDTDDTTLLDGCFALADRYEHLFSRTLPDSEIYAINHADGKPVTVSDETIELLKLGKEFGELSEGRFDITIGALSSLWDIPNNTDTIPSSEAIKEALSTVDYKQIQITGNTVTLRNPDTQIDLGGIAKGYLADAMKAYLNEHGCHEGIINLGGNVLTIGPKQSGEKYHIGIRKPFGEDDLDLITTVEVDDKSVVSSGRYERYFEKDGKIYHHILDTQTGMPYDNGLNGVTIISDSSVYGDALSTICFSLGLEDGMKFIESMDGYEAIFVDAQNELHYSLQ